ncbi:Primosomal protein I [Collimonas arenae]|uniref:Primosomal protein I n=1 Tax=Collimonas arenae TaxID=279058 RepID=A0A0A1F604_9BURK|nr:hypothetical protein [Collimonas arenae]AIY40143.1 Primosomal protein I [Collimonas arenae]
MRNYSKVSPKFWIGTTGKALRKQGVEALIVGMYLMTAPNANMLGLYYLPINIIAHETGLGLEGATKGLECAMQAGFCAYDHQAEMVWVYEMAAYQISEKLKPLKPEDKRCLGVQNDYNDLPKNQHLRGFYEKYAGIFNMSEMRDLESPINAALEAPYKPLVSQEQEQEQKQEQEQRNVDTTAPTVAVPSKKKHGTEEDHSAARWMFKLVLKVDATTKEPNWETWANDVRLMREIDNRSHRDICELFQWSKQSSFWCANILSPGKLREKWGTLVIQRDQGTLSVTRPIGETIEQTNARVMAEFLAIGCRPLDDGMTIDMEPSHA